MTGVTPEAYVLLGAKPIARGSNSNRGSQPDVTPAKPCLSGRSQRMPVVLPSVCTEGRRLTLSERNKVLTFSEDRRFR